MNITKTSEKFVKENLSIKKCLEKGLINYSALSRKIIEENKLKEKDFDAVNISLRRYKDKLSKTKKFEKKIREILKQTSIEVKNKIIVIILKKPINIEKITKLQTELKNNNKKFQIIEGINGITIITNEENESKIKSKFKYDILKITKNLVEITLKSPESLENTIGVTGYLFSLFAEENINIIETMSCWTDTILIIEEKGLEKSINILKF